MASPEEPAVAVEEVQDWLSAETVIATVVKLARTAGADPQAVLIGSILQLVSTSLSSLSQVCR